MEETTIDIFASNHILGYGQRYGSKKTKNSGGHYLREEGVWEDIVVSTRKFNAYTMNVEIIMSL